MDDDWPWSRSYVLLSLGNWGLFLLGVVLLSLGSAESRLPGAVLAGLALLLTASVGGQFVAAYRLIARQDEYVRGITAKRVIAAIGATITVAVLWGLFEQFLGAPDLPLWLVYPLFWGLFGVVTPLVRDTQP